MTNLQLSFIKLVHYNGSCYSHANVVNTINIVAKKMPQSWVHKYYGNDCKDIYYYVKNGKNSYYIIGTYNNRYNEYHWDYSSRDENNILCNKQYDYIYLKQY